MAVDELVTLAERLQGICLSRRLTVAAAESCTGGLVGHVLTEVPGSSGYFVGSLVTYSDEAKRAILGVSQETLTAHGAVSAQVAVAMASGARDALQADLAASVTGIAGPDGATPTKPVGLTYVAVSGPAGVGVERHTWSGDRTTNKVLSAEAVLLALIAAAEREGMATAADTEETPERAGTSG